MQPAPLHSDLFCVQREGVHNMDSFSIVLVELSGNQGQPP